MSVKAESGIEYATLYSNLENPDPVVADDLRPHLGNLNWQLRRLGIAVNVIADEQGRITAAFFGSSEGWTVTCDRCGYVFTAGRAREPQCVQCGTIERSRT